MNTEVQAKQVYLRPEAEIIEMKAESFLCQSVSPGGSEGTGDEELELLDFD